VADETDFAVTFGGPEVDGQDEEGDIDLTEWLKSVDIQQEQELHDLLWIELLVGDGVLDDQPDTRRRSDGSAVLVRV
jgi:hypothetical protein